jgi:hypothetical protein
MLARQISGLEPRLSSDSIDYQRFVEDALRDAVRRLLADVADQGMPGGHYFYIGFHTGHPAVVVPRSLRDLYPEEMTIILQHQFWNLEVHPDLFSVELSFSASRQRLSIPFAALTTFADPSAEFALRFSPRLPGGPEARGVTAAPAAAAASTSGDPGSSPRAGSPMESGAEAPAPSPSGRGGGRGDVIRFDPSRRK